MTRPSEIKPREDAQPGAKFAQWEIGAALPQLDFDITPDICEEYALAIGADPKGLTVDGRQAAHPTVLALYLLAVLYRKYPPQQGGVVIDQKFNFSHPIWADETTRIRATGRIEDKFEKRGRKYLKWSAEFSTAKGQKIASAANTVTFPE